MRDSSPPFTLARYLFAVALAALGVFCTWMSIACNESSPQSIQSVSSTPVSHTTQTGELIPIQDVQLGQRVVAQNPTGKVDHSLGTTVDPATWRMLIALAPKVDGTVSYVELLRPVSWLEEQAEHANGRITIRVPECGIDGEALLVGVEPCPTIANETGPIVTGYYQHRSAAVLDVHVEGLSQPVGVTANHPFWSEDRQEFVRADELRVGEKLSGIDSQPRITAIAARSALEAVYNLEVLGEHCYRVSRLSVLAHNPDLIICHDPSTLLQIGRMEAPSGASRHDGPRNFIKNNPGFEGTHEIHHSREWNVLKRYPGTFNPNELNLEGMMRPILKGQQLHGKSLHRSHIRKSWDAFQRQFSDRFDNGEISSEKMRELISRHAEYIDRMYLDIN